MSFVIKLAWCYNDFFWRGSTSTCLEPGRIWTHRRSDFRVFGATDNAKTAAKCNCRLHEGHKCPNTRTKTKERDNRITTDHQAFFRINPACPKRSAKKAHLNDFVHFITKEVLQPHKTYDNQPHTHKHTRTNTHA